MDWSSFLEKGNISLKILFPIAVLTGCLIFLPTDLKALLSVDTFATEHRVYIGPTFLVTSVLIISNFTLLIYNKANRQIRLNKIETRIKEDVKKLSYQEKSVLREFFLLGSDAIALPFQNATVAGLINKRIIYQVGAHGGMTYGEICMNYSLTDIAKDEIKPELIDFPATQSDINVNFLRENRPSWMKSRF